MSVDGAGLSAMMRVLLVQLATACAPFFARHGRWRRWPAI